MLVGVCGGQYGTDRITIHEVGSPVGLSGQLVSPDRESELGLTGIPELLFTGTRSSSVSSNAGLAAAALYSIDTRAQGKHLHNAAWTNTTNATVRSTRPTNAKHLDTPTQADVPDHTITQPAASDDLAPLAKAQEGMKRRPFSDN